MLCGVVPTHPGVVLQRRRGFGVRSDQMAVAAVTYMCVDSTGQRDGQRKRVRRVRHLGPLALDLWRGLTAATPFKTTNLFVSWGGFSSWVCSSVQTCRTAASVVETETCASNTSEQVRKRPYSVWAVVVSREQGGLQWPHPPRQCTRSHPAPHALG